MNDIIDFQQVREYWENANAIDNEYRFLRTSKINDESSKKSDKPYLSKISLIQTQLRLDEIKIGALLGRGGFGQVNEAYVCERRVALKIIHQTNDSTHRQQIQKSFVAERNIYGLRHKNIITFLGSNTNSTSQQQQQEQEIAFIIYEFAGKMNLNHVLMNSSINLTPFRRRSFALDLVNALEFIHHKNIVHMDLKPSNIIVTDSMCCKLTDFGCSIRLDDKLLMSETNLGSVYSPSGTIFYRAPELFSHSTNRVTTACDIYSLAICLWQLLTRDKPYYDENPHVIIYQIVSQNLRPSYPLFKVNENDLSRVAFERIYKLIIESCWNSNAHKRYTAKHVKELLQNCFMF